MPTKYNPWTGSISVDAPNDEPSIRKLYDAFAEEYDATLDQWDYRAPDVVARYLCHTVALEKTILDAGCGTGLTGAALARCGYARIVGSDLSPASIAKAQLTGHYQDLHVLNLSEPLPFDTNSFGGVICVGVFSYILDIKPVLEELLRVIEPGGTLAFTQREDLYKQRKNAALFDELHGEGNFDRLIETDVQPYLPGNPNFAEHLGVHYFVWRKHG